MLELNELTVRINTSEVLRGVSMKLPAGAVAALVGRNGAGKTSLMKSIMGILPVASGQILIDGKDALGAHGYERARNGVGYLPEDRRLIPAWTVEENLQFPLWACGRSGTDALEQVYEFIPELIEHRHRRALQLSGGQQKLVALGRSMIAGTKLLLLDEPFEGVAPALAERLFEVLSALGRKGGLTILMSESEFIHARLLVSMVFSIDRGTVKAVPPEEELIQHQHSLDCIDSDSSLSKLLVPIQ